MTVINSHKQELVFMCTEVYRTPSHECTKMTVTKTNITISKMQPNDILMGCKVFKVPFEWHINLMVPGHPQMILGACQDKMHEIKVSLDGFVIRSS